MFGPHPDPVFPSEGGWSGQTREGAMNVKQVLKPYVGGIQLGEHHAWYRSNAGLTEGLALVSDVNGLYFQLCFVALLLLFTGSCLLVIRFLNDPGRLGTLFTITGVSMVGLVAQMVSLWKQKVAADIIAVLARNLQPGEVRGVIELLFVKL